MAQGRASGLSLTQIIQKIERDVEAVQKEFLNSLVEEIVEKSPVWSGEYVNGHNVELGASSARGQFTGTLVNNPKTLNPLAEKQKALTKLLGQVQALPEIKGRISINNRVPHAAIVEYKGWKGRGPAQVYEGAMNKANVFLEEAIQTVKARQ